MIEIIRIVSVIICWLHLANGAANVEWSLNQKLKTIENSLVYSKNLSKFINVTHNDNNTFIQDELKAKRSYDNARCIRDLEWIQENINNPQNGWPLELFNMWGNLPSGDYIADYGSFKRCRRMRPMTTESIKIQSQYCFLNVVLKKKQRVVQTAWDSATLGICIPDSCAPTLIKNLMRDYVNVSQEIEIDVPADSCQLQGDYTKVLFRDKLMLVFIVLALLVVILSTIYEVACDSNGKQKDELLVAFSAISNGRALFSYKSSTSSDFFHFFHGMRVLGCFWITFGHMRPHYTIEKRYAESLRFYQTTFKHLFGGTSASVDTFFVLSGILVAVSVLKRLSQTNGRLEYFSLIFHRVLRLWPTLAFVAFFQMTLFRYFFDAPYNKGADNYRQSCENEIWKTLLFISNYLGWNCIGVVWYISADMQLFILAPFLVLLVHRNKNGPFILLTFSILLVLVFLTILLFPEYNAGNYYFATHYRFPAWLVGLNFGCFLYNHRNQKYSFPKLLNILTMTVLLGMLIILYYCAYIPVARMLAFRIIWSLALCYIIFVCVYGRGGYVNWFLSLPVWHPLSRMSYAMVLIGDTIMRILLQNAQEYSTFAYYRLFLCMIGAIILCATVVTLMIEMPVANLDRWFSSRNKEKKPSNEIKDEPK